MYYTIYKVTNKINGKVYIGCHKTKNLDDDYMGSGKYLRHSQEKHGIDNFEKEILFVYDNPKEMFAKEAEIVNEDFIAEKNTYNLKVGGHGGWDYVNSEGTISKEFKSKIGKLGRIAANKSLEAKYGDNWQQEISKKSAATTRHKMNTDPEFRKRFKKCGHDMKGSKNNMYGKKHTKESKLVMSEKHKGELNSQYGTMWIHSTELMQSKKINKDQQIPTGWTKGRKIKWD